MNSCVVKPFLPSSVGVFFTNGLKIYHRKSYVNELKSHNFCAYVGIWNMPLKYVSLSLHSLQISARHWKTVIIYLYSPLHSCHRRHSVRSDYLFSKTLLQCLLNEESFHATISTSLVDNSILLKLWNCQHQEQNLGVHKTKMAQLLSHKLSQ